MPTLATTVNGIALPNPFITASGPPGTNANVCGKALDEGWGAVVIKTISLDASKIINVSPRYARLRSANREIIGWENIELISDRPFDDWIDELHLLKDRHPNGVVITSIMEEYHKDRWIEIVERVQATGVAGLELNFSCPHGLPERQMGSAMGQDPAMLAEVCGWVMQAAKIPVWAKLTPNITDIAAAADVALKAGCDGVSAINTILCVMGVDLETLRPEPTVQGYTVAGGYSGLAVRPIALRMVSAIAQTMAVHHPGKSLSGIGGVETGDHAAQFILLGADTVQLCTGIMKHGYGLIHRLKDQLLTFMSHHNFATLADFKGHSLQYLTTHANLVQRQAQAKAAPITPAPVVTDTQWTSDAFVKQSDDLADD